MAKLFINYGHILEPVKGFIKGRIAYRYILCLQQTQRFEFRGQAQFDWPQIGLKWNL